MLGDTIGRVERAGFDVPTETVDLPLLGMTCTNCANSIERRLNKVEGVVEATVNFASESASVTYLASATSRAELVTAVRKAGYDVVEVAASAEGRSPRRRRGVGTSSRGAASMASVLLWV